MTQNHGRQEPVIDWAAAGRPVTGQAVSGDLHLVQPFARGVLLAVVDGLGHGAPATAAAEAAATILGQHPDEPAVALLMRCHGALAHTRGVVMTVATLRPADNTVTWLGIGNVEGRLLRANPSANPPSVSAPLRNGLVGYQRLDPHAAAVPIAPGDLLILATDGIRAGFHEAVNLKEPPRQIAERILEQYFKGTDDGLVLVARYLGNWHE